MTISEKRMADVVMTYGFRTTEKNVEHKIENRLIYISTFQYKYRTNTYIITMVDGEIISMIC